MERNKGVKTPAKNGFCQVANTLDGVKLVSFFGPDSAARNCNRCTSCKNGLCTNSKAKKSFGYKPGEEMKLDVPPRNRAVHCKEYDIY